MLAMVVFCRRVATWALRELVCVWQDKRHGNRDNPELALTDEPPGGGVPAEVLGAPEARWVVECEANGLDPLVVCADRAAAGGGSSRDVKPDGPPEKISPVGVHERLFQAAPTTNPAAVREGDGDRAAPRDG